MDTETKWIIGAGIIGAIIVIFVLVAWYRNRDAEIKLHPDPINPHIWYDDENNEYYR